MKRLIVALLVGGAVFGTVFAAAASLGGITSASLGADSAAVTSCDTDGVSVAFTTRVQDNPPIGPGFQVHEVVISGLNSACNGKYALVSLTNESHNNIAFGSSGLDRISCGYTFLTPPAGQISGGTVTVDLDGSNDSCGTNAPNAENIGDIHILIKDTPS
jgi:hypothetical protein